MKILVSAGLGLKAGSDVRGLFCCGRICAAAAIMLMTLKSEGESIGGRDSIILALYSVTCEP